MKIIIRIFVFFIIATSFVLAFRYNQESLSARESLEEERHKRFVAEEGWENTKARIATLELGLSKFQNKTKILERLVEQKTAINANLKTRLGKSSVLEKKLVQKVKDLEQLVEEKKLADPVNGT